MFKEIDYSLADPQTGITHIKRESYFQLGVLNQALQVYSTNFSHWDNEQRHQFWCDYIGRQQILLPMHMAQEICKTGGFSPNVRGLASNERQIPTYEERFEWDPGDPMLTILHTPWYDTHLGDMKSELAKYHRPLLGIQNAIIRNELEAPTLSDGKTYPKNLSVFQSKINTLMLMRTNSFNQTHDRLENLNKSWINITINSVYDFASSFLSRF